MPRARSSESEDVVVTKKPRAPRTRAVSMDGTLVAPKKRAPRKVTPKATSQPVAVVESEPVRERKAPTTIAADRKRSTRRSVALYVVSTICLLLVISGVVVGLFDHGQIDVTTIVTIRNEKIARGEVRDENGQPITTSVPVQTDNRPNGGLTIADPIVVTPVATTTSTTSVQTTNSTTTATSTETVDSTSTTTTP